MSAAAAAMEFDEKDVEEVVEEVNKVVLISSRQLKKDELVIFHRNLNLLEFNAAYHSHKQYNEMKYDVLFVYLKNKEALKWYSLNIDDMENDKAVKIVLLKSRGESIRKQHEYRADCVIKNIATDVLENKEKFLKQLLVASLPKLENKLEKCGRGFLSCVMG